MAVVAPTRSRARIDWRRMAGRMQDVILIAVCLVFANVHIHHVLDGTYTSAFFAVEQSFLAVMFLTRRRTHQTSTRPADWVVATVGGWLPLALRPAEGDALFGSLGTGIQLAGLSLTLFGFANLGKSFGIVAANRGVKVGGPYRFVRHPIYFSHFVTTSGFLLANFSGLNAIIFTVVSVGQLLRIRAEERILSQSEEYRTYQRAVRWRLLPGLY